MTQEELELLMALEQEWIIHSSQYRYSNNPPPLASDIGFKCGWFAALGWERKRVADLESRPPEDTL